MEATLSKLGLNKTEIAIYLALLPIGTAPASVLAYRLGIQRITARRACLQLVNKGLFSSKKKDNTYIFTVEAPEKISYLAENEKRQAEEKIEQANRIIGPLKAMFNPETLLPKVRFYNNAEGIKKAYEDTLKENKPIYAFENLEVIEGEVKDYLLKSYVPCRVAKNIFATVIAPNNKAHIEDRKTEEKRLRKTRLLTQKFLPMNLEIIMYGEKTAFMSYRKDEMFATILDSPAINESMKALFDYCWETLTDD